LTTTRGLQTIVVSPVSERHLAANVSPMPSHRKRLAAVFAALITSKRCRHLVAELQLAPNDRHLGAPERRKHFANFDNTWPTKSVDISAIPQPISTIFAVLNSSSHHKKRLPCGQSRDAAHR